MEIRIVNTEQYLKIEKIAKKEFFYRILFFIFIYMVFLICLYCKNDLVPFIIISFSFFPFIILFFFSFIGVYEYERIEINKNRIKIFTSIFYRNTEYNPSKFSMDIEIKNIEKIYFKDTSELFYIKGLKRNENPYCKVHFRIKGNQYKGFGLKLKNEDAKKIVQAIEEYLKEINTNSL